MSGGTWLKHLASTLITSRAFTLSRPLTSPFPSRFFTAHKPRNFSRPSTTSSSSSSSSSETSLAQPFALPFQSVNIRCQRHVSDMLQDALLCFGASSTSVDQDDDADEDSDEICITSIFPDGEDVDTCISHAAGSISLNEIPPYEVTIGEQYDWIKKTQESFHPVEISEGLWIVPSWKTSPNAQAKNIILNPGLAFGTGEHPTTRLCLLLLHGLIKGGEQFMDYGTGSGILAIAAIKFGAALSVGIDIDPQAITSARQNATLNNIGPEQMQLYLVPSENCSTWTAPCENMKERSSSGGVAISETDKYDVLIANILLNPLMDLADQIVSYAKPGATIGLSGILSEQLPSLMERYSQFLEDVSTTEMDGWVCVHGRKKQNVAGN
ncbi:uncharacterized protein LOC126788951 [Argentina anserina]|uniref:uncharacterized protein LOC126788951 n=1 Tax=Argentina anserina TaxID=57926 RepID=UPI0021762406|nr:uncharacterized protein LOC126788951 [Potentilla anserina]